MLKFAVPLAAVLLLAGCDSDEVRSGRITLSHDAPIPLAGRNGPGELVAGPASVTFSRGSKDDFVVIGIQQPDRPKVEIEVLLGDHRTGNFKIFGSEIGQPVDIESARTSQVTGEPQQGTRPLHKDGATCRQDISYQPCDETWRITFSQGSTTLGVFTSRLARQCNVVPVPGSERDCWRDREPHYHYPGYDYFPGPGYFPGMPHHIRGALEIDPGTLSFDGGKKSS